MSIPVQLVFSDGHTNTLHLAPGTKVLEAARERGIQLLTDCEEGNCGTCQARVSRGTVEMDEFSPAVLTESEQQSGVVLVCRARATEAAVIELPYSGDDALAASEAGSTAVVESIETVAADTMALTLTTQDALAFLPGQYVNITPSGDFHRSFSMANPPGQKLLTFYIALQQNGLFSDWLSSANVGDSVELSAPRGTFYLRDDTQPKIMVAGGTGLAPLLSMLEQIAQSKQADIRATPIELLVGARHENQLFQLDRLEQLKSLLPGLSIQVSCDKVDDTSPYRQGRVTELLDELSIDRSSSIYACGPPPMIDAVKGILKAKRIPARQLYVEKFIG
ncbi:2Fe-2S iron-sulfur cluster binding domain-containing protein [Pusillimonas noertemannii]|nr:2Fe-2S iron-sulfur cluster binding domain-containing protein [Pusillimonas noertemannii]NYT69214.1 2Fe-2S iron-sulfur cluster binding domain-containing protein [Pusillimonas noertemannii]